MKSFLVVAMLAGLAIAFTSAGKNQQVLPELKSREFMRRKLEHTQKVLEGIVLEDFETIEKNAKTLSLLSQAAEWQILPSAEYKKHGDEFRRTADALAKAAADKNIDGAALKYVELTLNCVNCHKHVRSFNFDKRAPAREGEKLLIQKDGKP
jgi:hypothetical protein